MIVIVASKDVHRRAEVANYIGARLLGCFVQEVRDPQERKLETYGAYLATAALPYYDNRVKHVVYDQMIAEGTLTIDEYIIFNRLIAATRTVLVGTEGGGCWPWRPFDVIAPRCGDLESVGDDLVHTHAGYGNKLPHGVVGSPTAIVLFVGDRGSNPAAYVDLPFWSTQGSSGYLLQAFRDAELAEEDLALVNAHEHKQGLPVDLRAVIKSLPQLQRVVALGNRAGAALSRQDIEHVQVPHPQYWKRFFHHQRDVYVQMIVRAVHEKSLV